MRIVLSRPFSLYGLLDRLEVDPNGLPDMQIKAISTDTRELLPGDLFFALRGKSSNGEEHIPTASKQGALTLGSYGSGADIPTVSGEYALLKCAEYYVESLPDLKRTVTITGSVGKTSTKEYLARLLSSEFKVHSTIKNYNNRIGVPLTVLSAPIDTEMLILEIGMSNAGEIAEIVKYIRSDISAITSIGTAHIGNFGSRKAIALAKSEIQNECRGVTLVPYDEPLLFKLKHKMTYGYNTDIADFSLYGNASDGYTLKTLDKLIKGLTIDESAPFKLKNIALASALAISAGASPDGLKNGLCSIQDADPRHRIVKCRGFDILDDTYNSSREAVIADLEYIGGLGYRNVSAFLGDILELGTAAEEIHTEIGERAARSSLSHLYLFGQYANTVKRAAIEAGFPPERIIIIDDLQRAVEAISKNSLENELVLFKASHKLGFSALVQEAMRI